MVNGKYVPGFTPQAINERNSWAYKAIAQERANKTVLGALCCAIVGRFTLAPCIHPCGARITKEGAVQVLFRPRGADAFEVYTIFPSVEDLTTTFRKLADRLQLNDDQRTKMFDEVRKFIRKDDRAVSTLDF